MFAIFETGGKQYRAEKGMKIQIEKIDSEAGESVDFSRVFLTSDGTTAAVGTPLVEGAKVTAKVISQEKADKIRVVKFQPKKRHKSVQGHRQRYTEIEITGITA